MEQQILDHKVGDVVLERHVYLGPQGHGYIDFEYRMNGQDIEKKVTHVGVENRPSHDFQVVPDETRTERQITGTTQETMDVVKEVETPVGSGQYQRIIVQEQHSLPVYSDVQVTYKHPYKAKHFGV